ncbi:hypothetical protein WA171_001124 [Blastocystis sp. BT1]
MESDSDALVQRTTTKQRKRIKSLIRERQLCIDYHRTGSCRFGENCKYRHGETTTETKDLLNGLLKTKCQAVMREQNSQLKCLKDRDKLLQDLSAVFDDRQITLSLYSPCLQQYTRLFVKRLEHDRCVDQYILLHFNGVCIMGLAESHFFIRNHLQIQSLQYGVTRQHKTITSCAVTGKSKKGGIWLDEDDTVCTLTSTTGEIVSVVAGIRGRLLELNESLSQNLNLITEKNATKGYICIIQPKQVDMEYLVNNLLSMEEYIQSLL